MRPGWCLCGPARPAGAGNPPQPDMPLQDLPPAIDPFALDFYKTETDANTAQEKRGRTFVQPLPEIRSTIKLRR